MYLRWKDKSVRFSVSDEITDSKKGKHKYSIQIYSFMKRLKKKVSKVFKESLVWKFGQNYPEIRSEPVLEGHVEFWQFKVRIFYTWKSSKSQGIKAWKSLEWSLNRGQFSMIKERKSGESG